MLTLPGVFAPISDSWQLADAVRREPLLAGSTDVDATVERMVAAGLVGVRVADRRVGPLGPLMQEQQRAGRIAADVTEEAVVVVRGMAPGSPAPSPRTRR